MKKVLTLNNQEIEYELRHSLKQGIKLSFHSDKEPRLVLSVSPLTSQKEIDRFLESHQRWILNRYNRYQDKTFYLFGKEYKLVRQPGNINKISINENQVILTMIKEDQNVEERLIKTLFKKLLEKYITDSLERYQMVTGKRNVKITYRYMTSRYGSCKANENKITLNTQLARYLPELIDSVVYHEYAHFVVGNHSNRFYKVLSGYDKDYLRHRKELISYPLYSFGKE